MAIINVSPGAGTLKAAIDTYGGDNEYHLTSGIYDEGGVLIGLGALDSNIKIVGPNAGIDPNIGIRVAEAEIKNFNMRISVDPGPVDNIEFDGCLFTGEGASPGQLMLTLGANGTSNFTFRNNITQRTSGPIIASSGPNPSTTPMHFNILIENNLFDGQFLASSSATDVVLAWDSGSIVQNNVSLDAEYAFLQIGGKYPGTSYGSDNVKILNNTMIRGDRKGLQVGPDCHDVLIKGNTIDNCNTDENIGHGGIRLYGAETVDSPTWTMSNIVITNNLIKNTFNSFLLHDENWGAGSYYTIKDNTIIGSKNADVYNWGITGSLFFDRNWWEDPDNVVVVDGSLSPVDLIVRVWTAPVVTNTNQLPTGLNLDSAYGVQKNGTLHAGGGFPFIARAVEEGKDKRPMVIVSSAGGATPTQAARGGLGRGSHSTYVTYRKP